MESSSRNPANNIKRRKTDAAKEDPMNILRATIKGFDIANPQSAYKGPDTLTNARGLAPTHAEVEAWKNPKHPTKQHLKMVGSYPILPDLKATTDDMGFVVVKFNGNPTDILDAPDPRMEAGLLRALEPTAETLLKFQKKQLAHKTNPSQYPDEPQMPLTYQFFLPTDNITAANLKRKFDIDNEDNDSADLYTSTSQEGEKGYFRYTHIRMYETGLQTSHQANPYQEIALALHDPEFADNMADVSAGVGRRTKAAYYYPIIAKQQLKPRREVNLGMGKHDEEEGEKIDVVHVTIGAPDEDEIEKRGAFVDDLVKEAVAANGA